MGTNWTKEEIEKYKEIRKRELGPLYATAGIPIDNPGERTVYLLGLLDSKTKGVCYEKIMKTAVISGRDKALRILEDLAIQTFF